MKHPLRFLPLCALAGCASLSSYQEARTLDKGQARMAISATPFSDNRKIHDLAGIVVSNGHESMTSGFGIRYGLWSGIDAGIASEAPYLTNWALDVKTQFAGLDSSSTFQSSIGLKAAVSKPFLEYDSLLVVSQAKVFDITVPVHLGWTPNSWFAVNAIPDFTWRTSDNSNEYPGGAIVGANLNARLGRKFGLMAEFGLHHHLTRNYDFKNAGFAIYLRS